MHTSEVASHRLNALQLLFAFVINGLAEVIQVKRVDAGLPESEPAPATSDQRRSGGDGRMTMGRKWGTNLIIWHRNFEEKDVLIDICNICGTTTIVSQFRKDIIPITSGVSSQLCYSTYTNCFFFNTAPHGCQVGCAPPRIAGNCKYVKYVNSTLVRVHNPGPHGHQLLEWIPSTVT